MSAEVFWRPNTAFIMSSFLTRVFKESLTKCRPDEEQELSEFISPDQPTTNHPGSKPEVHDSGAQKTGSVNDCTNYGASENGRSPLSQSFRVPPPDEEIDGAGEDYIQIEHGKEATTKPKKSRPRSQSCGCKLKGGKADHHLLCPKFVTEKKKRRKARVADTIRRLNESSDSDDEDLDDDVFYRGGRRHHTPHCSPGK